jgi:hypothetical protein
MLFAVYSKANALLTAGIGDSDSRDIHHMPGTLLLRLRNYLPGHVEEARDFG